MRHFSVGLSHMMASGLCATHDDDRLSGSIETKLLSPSQNQTGTRKGSWSLRSNPLQFSKPSDETMISEKFDQYHWWAALKIAMPAAGTGKQKGPISPWCCSAMCHTNKAPKVERIRLLSCVSPVILYYIHYIHLTFTHPIATPTSIPATFCRENTCPTSKMNEMLSTSSVNPEVQIFNDTWINKLISSEKYIHCNDFCFY